MNKKIIAFVLAGVFAASVVSPVGVGAITDAEYQTLLDNFNQLTALYNTLLAQISGPAATTTGLCTTGDLSSGMTSAEVKILQQGLNQSSATQVAVSGAGAPGYETSYFGALTKAAVSKFQTIHAAEVLTPLGLTNATGYFGQSTRTKFNALYCTPVVPTVTYPAGCTSAVGFSTTTGLPCSEVTTLPEGCTSAVGFSPTTGLSCAGTTTTTVGPSYGSLSVTSYPVSNPQTTLYGGITYEVAAGQYKATGSDITIRKIPVEIISAAATVFPWQAFTAVSIWDGSTQLVSVPVVQANLIENTFAKDYTLDISGLNIVIPKTTQKVLTVKVDAITNAVIAVTGTTFTVKILASGVVNMDTAGVTYTAVTGSNVDSAALTLSAAQAATITTTAATDNPLAGNVLGSKTATTKVDLLKFNVKVENVNVTFNSGSATLTDADSVVTSLELWDGSTLVSSDAPAAGVIAWSNFTLPISAGTTKVLTLKANLIQLASGYAGTSVVSVSTGPVLTGIDTNSNVISAAGSAVTGGVQHIYVEAPTLALTSATFSVSGSSASNTKDLGSASIGFTVTANGGDIYIPKLGNTTTTGAVATIYADGVVATPTSSLAWTCNAPAVSATAAAEAANMWWRIPSGSSANCQVTDEITNTGGTAGTFNVDLSTLSWSANVASTTTAVAQTWGLDTLKTGLTYLGI